MPQLIDQITARLDKLDDRVLEGNRISQATLEQARHTNGRVTRLEARVDGIERRATPKEEPLAIKANGDGSLTISGAELKGWVKIIGLILAGLGSASIFIQWLLGYLNG